LSDCNLVSCDTVYEIDPNEIVIPPKRQRQKIDISKVNVLATSVEQIGQQQPGVCRLEDDNVVLIVGHRRLLACRQLKIPYQYILKENISDPRLLHQIELEENVCRENLTFLEESQARAELHKLYEQTKGSQVRGSSDRWNMRKSASEMHVALGTLADDIKITQWAEKIPEVAGAKTRSEAKKIIKRHEQTVIQHKKLEQIAQKQKSVAPAAPAATATATPSLAEAASAALDEFNKHIHQVPMEEFLAERHEIYDIVFFDPPWGVNFNTNFQLDGSRKPYDDSAEKFFSDLPRWLELIYQSMSANSHLYLKFGIIHSDFVYSSLTRAGFRVEGIPIIWHKRGAHRTRQPHLWPGRSYEPIAFAHKGSKDLSIQGAPNLIETPVPSPKLKSIHPSAMHPKLPFELLRRSGFPGNRVLDPMCGSGMTAVACEAHQKDFGFSYDVCEIDPDFCDLTRTNLLKGYDSICSEPVELDESADYHSVTPGSPQWMKIWTAHPELHDVMMAYSKGENQ